MSEQSGCRESDEDIYLRLAKKILLCVLFCIDII